MLQMLSMIFLAWLWLTTPAIAQTEMACTMEYAPVCGVDQKTYSNACMAKAAGVVVAAAGECSEGGVVVPVKPDKDCVLWYDGCNDCQVVEGQIKGCTKRACIRLAEAKCLKKVNDKPNRPAVSQPNKPNAPKPGQIQPSKPTTVSVTPTPNSQIKEIQELKRRLDEFEKKLKELQNAFQRLLDRLTAK